MYSVTKNYGQSEGLSCCFRQWRADSHCNLLHGYSLGVTIKINSNHLNRKNWVFDFGGFKPIRKLLHDLFDHTCLIAEDDPRLDDFKALDKKNLINLKVLQGVGCEKFSELIYNEVTRMISWDEEVWVESVTVYEHESNSATFNGKNAQVKNSQEKQQ